jgi:mono/diheme cytochrome c family protein
VATTLALAMTCAASSAGMFSKEQTEQGKRAYQKNCAACHGEQLEGGEHAPPLKDDDFWEAWRGKTLRQLYSRIISSMPPSDPGSLSEKDVIDIVANLVRENGVPEGDKAIERANELNSLKLEQPKRDGGGQ